MINNRLQLSEHFTLQELTVSEWASRHDVDNTPTGSDIMTNLHALSEKLEEIRGILGHPITVNSGYRSPKVNKAIGGKPTSSHQYGLAVDFKCPAYGSPEQIVRALAATGLKYDQLILEFATPDGGGWVHLGIGKKNRQQLLTINKHGAFAGIRI